MEHHSTRTDFNRNAEIIRLHTEEKWTYSRIAEHFSITSARVCQIINRDKLRNVTQQAISGYGPTFYSTCIDAAKQLNISENQATKAFHCLLRSGVYKELKPGEHNLANYSDEELLCIRGIGKASLAIIRLADDIFLKRII